MNARLSSAASLTLHIALLAMLSLVGWRTHERASVPTGMAIEIIDLDHAMPLPDPHLARAEDARTETAMETPEFTSRAATMTETVTPPIPVTASTQPRPETNTAPILQTQPVPDSRILPAAKAMPALAPVPILRSVAPAVFASLSRGLKSSREPDSATPAPAPRRLDTAALSRTLASKAGQAQHSSLDSAAIGSAIGEAVPKGVAGLTIRQRANLVAMIRSQITPCWNPPIAEEHAGHVTVILRISLDRSGGVAGTPAISRITGRTAANAAYANALAGSVRRAVLRCAPLNLPSELYDAWARVELNFDPKDVQ